MEKGRLPEFAPFSSFLYINISREYHVASAPRSFLNISLNEPLLVVGSLSFCLPTKVFISERYYRWLYGSIPGGGVFLLSDFPDA